MEKSTHWYFEFAVSEGPPEEMNVQSVANFRLKDYRTQNCFNFASSIWIENKEILKKRYQKKLNNAKFVEEVTFNLHIFDLKLSRIALFCVHCVKCACTSTCLERHINYPL